jgi:hypothetical protein
MLLKPSLAFLLLFMFSNTANASDENACIKSSVAAIAGLLPGMDKASLDKVNKYLGMETATGEDDGGYYEAQIYHYSKYDITIVRGIIDSISITSPELLWAQKIKIGTDRNIVEKHIKVVPVVNEITSSQYVVCSSVGDVYAIFNYHNNKIKTIEVSIDRP